jgi:hypothetical protein
MPLVVNSGASSSTGTTPDEFKYELPEDFCDDGSDQVIYPACIALQQNCAEKADCIYLGCEMQRNGISVRRRFTTISDENQCLGNQRKAITDYEVMVEISVSKVLRPEVLGLAFPGIWGEDGDYNKLTLSDPTGGTLPTYRILIEDCAMENKAFKLFFPKAELDPDTEVTLQFSKTLSDLTLSFRAMNAGGSLGRGYIATRK